MKVLLVVAHPLPDSLCAHLSRAVERDLAAAGHQVDRLDLHAEGFAPVLTAEERRHYFDAALPLDGLEAERERLKAAEALILVFPTWWFSMPAILKGWFDRVWVPGTAFDVGTPIKPRLTSMRACLAVTTLGSPAWIDWLVMRRPVARVLGRGILKACAPQARFRLLSLHGAESVSAPRLAGFEARLGRAVASLIRS